MARLALAALAVVLASSAARGEPRQLLLRDGTVVGAIAVAPPDAWPALPAARPDEVAFRAFVEVDGLWAREAFGGERGAPRGNGLALALGAPIDAVPWAPRSAFQATLQLRSDGGVDLAELYCATTEVLAALPDGGARVRVYRMGPAGERYVLEGRVAEAPVPDAGCLPRALAFDTGTAPPYWQPVDPRVKPFVLPATVWVRGADRCVPYRMAGGVMTTREVTYEDGCRIVDETTVRYRRAPGGRGLFLSGSSTARRGCRGHGLGASFAGSWDDRELVLVAADADQWRWLRTGATTPGPVLYHPDDVVVWTRTRAACEAPIADRIAPPRPVGKRAVDFCGVRLQPETVAVNACPRGGDLGPLAELPGLRDVVLYDVPAIVDLRPLAGLVGLETVRLPQSSVEDLTPLAGLEALRWLDVGGSRAHDLTPLAGLRALEILDLQRTPVKDLTPLHGLERLRTLYVNGTGVDDAAVDALQEALPRLRVHR